MINDSTGAASSTFVDGVGAAQARVALQNAEGGVDGRKLDLVVGDSQSSPTEFQTAAEDLVESKGVFGIVSDSSFTFGGSSYLTKAGVPVTGEEFDGPEWGTAPNMFTYGPPGYTMYNGTSYSYDTVSKLLKSVGAKKVAVLAYGISPSAVLSAAAAGGGGHQVRIVQLLREPLGSLRRRGLYRRRAADPISWL